MLRGYYRTGLFPPSYPVQGPIKEAIQLLDHAELVYLTTVSTVNGEPAWTVTRFGLATLASGKAAVRQRIKDRTGL